MADSSNQQQQQQQQGGDAAASTAPAIVNPHNPEFLTKKPWYLSGQPEDGGGGAAAAGGGGDATLEHQQKAGDYREELTLADAERALALKRKKEKEIKESGQFFKGQWAEALKQNRPPYRICQIVKVHGKKGSGCYDIQFEDGTVERKVKVNPSARKPQIRSTRTGNRSDIAAVQDKKETFDSKRDKYHGYELGSFNTKITAKFEEREAIRRKIREEGGGSSEGDDGNDKERDDGGRKDDGEPGGGGDISSDSDDDGLSDDEFHQRDEDAKVLTTRLARQGGVGGAQMKVTARNLRIREDTAKYLRNLDPNSAYYDPKSRSMRDNPLPQVEDSGFTGDNFARSTGDAVGLADTQLFAWDAAEKGVANIHPQANPSQAELLKKEFRSKESELAMQRKRAVLEKYGGQEHLDGTGGLASAAAASASTSDGDKKPAAVPVIDKKLRFGVSTTVEEYSRDGRLLKSGGKEVKQMPIESKFEEDIFINGHTTVWGSYFHKGAFQWGTWLFLLYFLSVSS